MTWAPWDLCRGEGLTGAGGRGEVGATKVQWSPEGKLQTRGGGGPCAPGLLPGLLALRLRPPRRPQVLLDTRAVLGSWASSERTCGGRGPLVMRPWAVTTAVPVHILTVGGGDGGFMGRDVDRPGLVWKGENVSRVPLS